VAATLVCRVIHAYLGATLHIVRETVPDIPLISPAIDAFRNLGHAARSAVDPVLRIGVTGLARSGKTVFTTALVHQLLCDSDLPALGVSAQGRLRRAKLAPQPDDAVPRFAYEAHLARLIEDRLWPHSTTRISELRLVLEYERAPSFLPGGPSRLTLDIVDYPGEWLLDLALIEENFADWSRETIAAARHPQRAGIARSWLTMLEAMDPDAPADEAAMAKLADAFKAYLDALRAGPEAVATTPPGRFLMPGDLAGSPALTFAPLALKPGHVAARNSFAELMIRRFEAYKTHVVRPFFRNHFQHIDRQIVLVDVLSAMDGGANALGELEQALDRVLLAMRVGRNTLLSQLFAPRTERILFAATKADHLHQSQHKQLEAILRHLVERAMRRVEGAGAQVGAVALAAVRATHETTVRDGGHVARAVAGTPEAGERIGDTVFDGAAQAAIFPGELPDDPRTVLDGGVPPGSLRFPRFRPPPARAALPGRPMRLPHIRLDRALEFLIGDRFG